ncbi:hypothetical protein TSAR_012552 [Trichomalopsis sarcophagae]|uniref:Uncharacterized protein n=1 Tax=Trichomalopsis sarcophagae TaxID=543379 RepID=A0A232ERZ3_9HYME|nr:hypothetical protein TSAR_012552 [Trichomalopsis sarcophagae]
MLILCTVLPRTCDVQTSPNGFEKFNCQYLALKLTHSKRPGVKITL